MVPLTERSDYVSRLRENQKFNLFFSWLYNITDEDAIYNSQALIDEVFSNCIYALKNNDSAKFTDFYNQISVREPNKNSPFSNDDLLLFVLIVGIKRYNLNIDWVQKVLDVRQANDSESRLIKSTFQNILKDNYVTNGNSFQIIIPIESIFEKDLITWREKKEFYNQIVTTPFPFYKSEFLNVLSLRSFDLVIVQCDVSDDSTFYSLRSFKTLFLQRVNALAKITYWAIYIILIAAIAYIIFTKKFQDYTTNLGAILGLLGTGILSFFNREKIVKWLEVRIQRTFGLK